MHHHRASVKWNLVLYSVMKKCPYYWLFVRRIHRSPVDSPQKGLVIPSVKNEFEEAVTFWARSIRHLPLATVCTLVTVCRNLWAFNHTRLMQGRSACQFHYNDVIMGAMASQITSLTIVYSTVYSRRRSKKHQSSASLAFVLGIHRWPVNSPHEGPVTW